MRRGGSVDNLSNPVGGLGVARNEFGVGVKTLRAEYSRKFLKNAQTV